MAASITVRTVTISAAGDTRSGTLAVAAPGSATEKIVGVFVKKAPPEFDLKGVTLSNVAQTAGSVLYNCRGLSGATYDVVLTVTDVAIS